MKKADNEKKASTENTTKRGNVYEWIQCIIMALIVCVVVFVFIVRLVDVVGSSMYPTLENGDKMIVTDVFYKPKYGDIVVFQKDEYADYALVKRVIATEGQTVEIDFDRHIVYVDGKNLTSRILPSRRQIRSTLPGFRSYPKDASLSWAITETTRPTAVMSVLAWSIPVISSARSCMLPFRLIT